MLFLFAGALGLIDRLARTTLHHEYLTRAYEVGDYLSDRPPYGAGSQANYVSPVPSALHRAIELIRSETSDELTRLNDKVGPSAIGDEDASDINHPDSIVGWNALMESQFRTDKDGNTGIDGILETFRNNMQNGLTNDYSGFGAGYKSEPISKIIDDFNNNASFA